MAKQTYLVCDLDGSKDRVETRRVGDKDHLYTADLCFDDRQRSIDDLIAAIVQTRTPRAGMHPTTIEEVEKDRRRFRREKRASG